MISKVKPVISRTNKELVAAISAYRTKSVRDKVILHVSHEPRLTFQQKLDFVDVARTVWADQDRQERQAKQLNEVYDCMLESLEQLKTKSEPSKASKPCRSIGDLINALQV